MKIRILCMFALLPLTAFAQTARDVAPLRNWSAPLTWQPPAQPGDPIRIEAVGDSPAQSPANSLVFVAMTPCRVADTRTGFGFSGPFGPPSLSGGATRAFPIQESTTCTIPSIAKAYSFNLTVVTSSFLNYLTIWPLGSTQPNASTLNDDLGTVVANAAIVPAGNDSNGSVNVYVSNNTDFIIDINGYYAAQTGITLAQGTVAAPSLSFAGDSGTGVFSPGTGSVSFTSGGLGRLTVVEGGDVDIPGSLRKGGFLFLHNLGSANTAVGLEALNASTGTSNTATGQGGLFVNTTGHNNVADGFLTLGANTTGGDSTAVGYSALAKNTTGNGNTAAGFAALNSTTAGTNTATGNQALQSDTTGVFNTADGSIVLITNTTGSSNTGVGVGAMEVATTASFNTGFGYVDLQLTTTGANNTAAGGQTLTNNTTGSNNTALGAGAMYGNTTGGNNTALGGGALGVNTTGGGNIGIGAGAGFSLSSSGANNIDIGNAGVSGDSGVIRAGTAVTQAKFFVAGVRGTTTGVNNAVALLVDSNGQLGTISSSRRFKEEIHDMGDSSSGLSQLRPVTFRYKQPYADGSQPIDYGLIAEEVAQVYPDLVVKDAEGQVQTVQYQKLTPMMINEFQKVHQRGDERAVLLGQQADAIRDLQAQIGALKAQISAAAEK